VFVYLVMNYVVIPLSRIGVFPSPPPAIWITGVLVHMFFIGVPIALAARQAFGRVARPGGGDERLRCRDTRASDGGHLQGAHDRDRETDADQPPSAAPAQIARTTASGCRCSAWLISRG
jgi:hypothetical protein